MREGTPVPFFSYLSEKEVGSLTASRWVFAHKRLDGGFAVEYHLFGVHEDVETASYVTSINENGVPNKNRDGDLKFSFNVQEPFGLSGEDNS